MDKNAFGLAAIGVLECLVLLAFAVAPPRSGGDATSRPEISGFEHKDSASRVPSKNDDDKSAINYTPVAPQSEPSICADVHAGFICSP